jgi:hypothetical protein
VIKRIRIAVGLLVCLFGLSSVARAGFIDLIDELSGPGPFIGYGAEIRVYCTGVENESGKAQPLPDFWTTGKFKSVKKGLSYSRCLTNELPTSQRPSISIDLAFSYSHSFHFGSSDPANIKDTTVSIYSLAPSIWWNPIPPVAVGTGLGIDTFRGAQFSTFSRLYLNPVKVELKPFAFAKHQNYEHWFSNPASWFTIRADYLLFPKGFDAQDFGSTGTFHTEHESIPRVTILFDLGQWSWLR